MLSIAYPPIIPFRLLLGRQSPLIITEAEKRHALFPSLLLQLEHGQNSILANGT